MILLQITFFGLTVSEIVLLGGIVLTLLGFVLFYKSDKKKKTAEARTAHLTADNLEITSVAHQRDQHLKWLADLKQIQDTHHLDLTKISDENKKLLSDKLQEIEAHNLTRAELRQTVKSFRRLMVKLELPYWETDADGDLIYVNGRWLQLFGLTLEEAQGKNWKTAVEQSDLIKMEVGGDAHSVDGDDDYSPIFTIHNSTTNESYKVEPVYVLVRDGNDKGFKSFGITRRINEN